MIPSPAAAVGAAPAPADSPALSIIVLGAGDGAFTEHGVEVLTADRASINRALASAAGALIAVANGAGSDDLFAQAMALDANRDAAVAYDGQEPAGGLLDACLTGNWPALGAVTFRAPVRDAVWPIPPAADPLRWILAHAAAAAEAIAVPASSPAREPASDDPELRRRLLQELDLSRVSLLALVEACESLPAIPVTAAAAARRDALIDDAVAVLESGDAAGAARRLAAARAFDSATEEMAETLRTLVAGVEAVAGSAPAEPAAAPVQQAAAVTLEPPAPQAKRQHLLDVLTARGHRAFVESGTYLGESVEFLRPHVDRIVTVEVEPKLHADAARKFAGDTAIEVLLGDSLVLIPEIVASLDESALIWLDGHFSGGLTGLGEYVEPAPAILEKFAATPPPAGSTVMVDDLRMFGRDPEPWPTLDGLVNAARRAFPGARIYPGLDALIIES